MSHRAAISSTLALLFALTALAAGSGGTSAQAASGVLVSNLDQTSSTFLLETNADRAQAFTTGADIEGYAVTSVAFKLHVAANATPPTYSVFISATDSSGRPTGGSLGWFSRPGALVTGTNTFTLQGGGSLQLKRKTTYAVVFDVHTPAGNNGFDVSFRYTTSNNEDAGAVSSWSIADASWHRAHGASVFPTGLSPRELQVSISGSLGHPVYGTLESYFEGELTADEIASIAGGRQSYHEWLRAKTEAGALDGVVPAGRTAWGTAGTENWVQKGSPSYPGPDPSLTCGGEPKPGLARNELGDFFWACTGNNRWVPIRVPRPGVDFSRDDALIKPGQPGYDERCRFVQRDENGNEVLDEQGNRIPEPAFRAHFDENGRPLRNSDGTIQGTHILGHNWDPIAEYCTGRGGP